MDAASPQMPSTMPLDSQRKVSEKAKSILLLLCVVGKFPIMFKSNRDAFVSSMVMVMVVYMLMFVVRLPSKWLFDVLASLTAISMRINFSSFLPYRCRNLDMTIFPCNRFNSYVHSILMHRIMSNLVELHFCCFESAFKLKNQERKREREYGKFSIKSGRKRIWSMVLWHLHVAET